MTRKFETRLARLEAKFRPQALPAVIQGFFQRSPESASEEVPGCLPADDPRLQDGVDGGGNAFVSRWWAVTFFEGSIEQQNERLKELRLDPLFQKPWNEDEIPAYFEGGATCDDVFARLHEEMLRERARSSSATID